MELLTKEELASYLKVSEETVKYLLYRKKLPKVRIGKEYRFVKKDIEAWVEHHKEKPKTHRFNFGKSGATG